MTEPDSQRFTVTAGERPQRLDHYLGMKLHGPSRAKIQRWIEAGRVLVNETPRRAAHKVRPGDQVTVCIPPPVKTGLRPEAIPLEIIYEDDHLLVVNKPAGLVVHPAPGHDQGTLVNALLHYCYVTGVALGEIGGRERPGLVHRLDKETSGLLVVAKTEAAMRGLVSQFKHHTIERRYVALAAGRFDRPQGEIVLAIGRDRVHRKKFSARTSSPRPSTTRYRLLQQFENAALVEVTPLTGRTHQIRVHFSAIHHPLLGDALYGGPATRRLSRRAPSPRSTNDPDVGPPITRQMLHAQLLGLRHPATGQAMRWEAPPPGDMAAVIDWFRRHHRVDKG
jgi:23S rRNA pseudouridine1911/1915/1917 synthase